MAENFRKARFHQKVPSRGDVQAVEFPVHVWSPDTPKATLVLLHPLSGCGHDFEALASHLAQQGFRCLAPDLPGHGEATPLPQGQDPDAVITRCVLNLAKDAGSGPLMFLGTSWGGHILLPVLLSGLVRVDGAIFNDIVLEFHDHLDALPARVAQKSDQRPTSFAQVRDLMMAEADGPYRQSDLALIPAHVFDAWAMHRFEERDGVWTERFDAASVGVLAPPPKDLTVARTPARLLARLKCPVVMIYGKDSPFSGTRNLQSLLDFRPNVSLLTLSGGHAPKLMIEDQIVAVAKCLADMLDKAQAASR